MESAMNRIFGVMLSTALLCGGAGAAMAANANANMEQPCEAQLQAQVNALQAQVTALQADVNVQYDAAPAGQTPGDQIPTGG
jgi:hypothetical protein